MVTIIISFLVVVLSFNFFMMSYQINGINRLVMSAPMSLYETAINVFEIDEEKGPYFDKEILEENITYYFTFHMPRYTEDYQLDFYYYNPIDHSLDMNDEVKAVEVTINANIILYYHYQKTMYYEIWRN
jgi:hypothetical protein